jgi:undecaprenyl-phosphate galactose phosphotransferase
MRSIVRNFLDARDKWEIPVLLIGNGASAEAVVRALRQEPGMGFNIVEQIAPETLGKLKGPNAWKSLLTLCNASHVFLALESSECDKYSIALKALVRERIPSSIIPAWLSLPTGTLSQHHFLMHDVLLLHDTNRLYLPVPRFLKRSFDCVVSALALLLLSPVFIAVALKIRKDGGPAIFSQTRVGKNGVGFQCYKFRSMRTDAEAFLGEYLAQNPEAAAEWRKFQKLKNDIRISRIGHFIRRTSIDELPQLFNVLKGDMSLVGPRPIIESQQEFYGDDFVYYKSVRPGITGPWQVSGRNKLTFPERVALECSYARNWSLWMDIVILLKTIPAVLKKDNVF